jgi:hypothetical protein
VCVFVASGQTRTSKAGSGRHVQTAAGYSATTPHPNLEMMAGRTYLVCQFLYSTELQMH